jgi:hypothetical protein
MPKVLVQSAERKPNLKTTETQPAVSSSRTTAPHVGRASKPAAILLLEFDASRVAIIEPAHIIKPIDIAEHCVLCFFQEVIRELVSGGAGARQVHIGRSEAGDYPVMSSIMAAAALQWSHQGSVHRTLLRVWSI